MNKILKSTVSGPRWAKFPSFIKDLAWMLDLKIDVETDKGWLTEDIRFRVEGEEDKVDEFYRRVKSAIKKYNSD